jgi:DNA-binding CsgD family transcriptional regulator
MSIERRYDRGPVEQEAVRTLNALRPHIARAAVLSARVGVARAKASVLALETVGLPAAVLAPSRRVVAANALLEGLAPAVAIGAGDLLSFEDRAAQAMLTEALRTQATASDALKGRSFPMPARNGGAAAVAHLFPLRGAGRDVFTGASYLLYVTVLSRQSTLPTPILQALFDLTPREARIAELIGGGRSVATVARQLGVQANTVRVHLKAVFAKTGAQRQADLVGLLAAPSHASPSD